MSSSLPCFALAASLALSAPAAAQPRLLADLAPQLPRFDPIDPRTLRSLGEGAVFVARSGLGHELWRTDGTAAGTMLLADLCPGFCSGPPQFLGTVGEHHFFATSFGSSTGRWLLRTDGTPAGWLAVAGPFEGIKWLGITGSRAAIWVEELQPFRSRLLLGVDADGSEIEVLARTHDSLFAGETAESGGRVFFSGDTGLWVSDGTPAGTRHVAGGGVGQLVPVDGGIVFWGGNGALSFTGGGEPSTLAREERLEGGLFAIDAAPDGEGRVFFRVQVRGGHALWVTDGTAGGTRRLEVPLVLGEIGASSGRAYFSATDSSGSELWTSDGTALGTRRIVDLCPGACSAMPHLVVPFGPGALFAARDEPEGTMSLWYAEGTARPRHLIDGLAPFPSQPEPRVEHRDALFLVWNLQLWRIDRGLRVEPLVAGARGGLATAGPWVLFEKNGSLWRTDGTAAGTGAIPVTTSHEAEGSDPTEFVEHEGRACFLTRNDLWCSDGSAVEKIASELFEPRRLMVVGERLFAVTDRSIGVVAGGVAKDVLPPESFDVEVGSVGVLAEELFFVASGPDALWKTDGTREGTRPVVPALRAASKMVTLGGRLIFTAAHGRSSGVELWSSDGTEEGTIELPVEGSFLGRDPVLFRGAAWIAADGRLWRTDGTVAGTAPVLDLPPLDQSPDLELLATRDRLLIVGTDVPIRAIWSTDGISTPQKLLEIERLVEWEAVALGERLLLGTARRGEGRDLWVTDGTPAGTRTIDVETGSAPFDPRNLAVVGEHVLFAGRTLADGAELWITDGTREGTRRLFELAPGPASSFPAGMTRVGDLLFFTADDGVVGREPWVVEWDRALGGGPCEPSNARLCLDGGRFALTVGWRDPYNGGEGRGHAVPFPGSDQTGTFWFFDSGNVELIVKTLDGRAVNGHHWVFYGALTTVEYWIDVLDTQTGETRRYHNPAGEQCGRGDTTAFAGAALGAVFEAPPAASAMARRPAAAPAAAGCDGPTTLCLLGGSLAVEVGWHDPRSGDRGQGRAIPGSDNTGSFWFFDAANVELVVKALDGTTVNGHRWVFYGGLSDVEYEIRVIETATGATRTYRNPFGEICGGADTAAF